MRKTAIVRSRNAPRTRLPGVAAGQVLGRKTSAGSWQEANNVEPLRGKRKELTTNAYTVTSLRLQQWRTVRRQDFGL